MKQIIKINRNDIKQLVKESLYKSLLLEHEGTNLKEARKWIRLNYRNYADKAKEIVNAVRANINNARVCDCKFITGLCRMYLNGELNDADVQRDLGSVLPYVAVHEKEFTRNLEIENGEDKKPLSAQELIDRYKGVRDTDRTAKREIINQKEYIRNEDYDIIPINSFEESRKYEKYTNPNSRWCLTYDEDMFDSYTSNGINQMYFCLKKGFENIQPIKGEGCPRDEYGLSMISVIVDEQGYLAYCTSRWNHANGGNDHILEEDGLSDLLGVRFPDVFKPNRNFQDALEERFARLKNGEGIGDVFDEVKDTGIKGWYIIRLFKKYNILKQDYTLLCDKWFYEIGEFTEGFAMVCLGPGQYNFIDTSGNLLSKTNFKWVWKFSEGFAKVMIDEDQYNFIDTSGNLLSKTNFKWVWKFSEGFAAVEINRNRWNFIDTSGNLLCRNNFKWARDFSEGFAAVEINRNRWNFIDKSGNFLSKTNFSEAWDFSDGFAQVKIDEDQWNILDTSGNLVLDRNYPEISWVKGNIAVVIDDYGEPIEVPLKQSNTQIQETIRINRNDIRQLVLETITKML